MCTTVSTPRPYSLLDVGLALPTASSQAGPVALRVFQAVFFLICLVIPLLWLLLLAVLWLVPLRPAAQHRLFIGAEVAHAWAALDVFILTVIASLLELNQFAQFIVGDECDPVNAALKQYFSALVDEPRCFVVDARLETGMWLLFAASFVSMATGHAVMHGGIHALEDHERRLGRTERIRRLTIDGATPPLPMAGAHPSNGPTEPAAATAPNALREPLLDEI